MNRLSYVAAALALVAAPPVLAVETIAVGFATPDGVTKYAYSGNVHVTVSGAGQSLGRRVNDAFYLFAPGSDRANKSYYQLTFGTSSLLARQPKSQDAAKFIVGDMPTYSASHVYSFVLDTGTATPKKLHFGVSDGAFGDNTGGYKITLAVPEPAIWGMMLAGFAVIGVALRRRQRDVVAA